MKKVALPKPRKPKGTLCGYYERLKKLGYTYLSGGAYSSVYVKDKVVVKVAEGGGGYDDFLEYALAYQNNPYFPKIYAVERYEDVKYARGHMARQNYTVVTMELLDGEDCSGKLSSSIRNNVDCYRRDMLVSDCPKEKQALKVLAALEKKHGWLDLHSGNVMMRGAQPVIIDPVAG